MGLNKFAILARAEKLMKDLQDNTPGVFEVGEASSSFSGQRADLLQYLTSVEEWILYGDAFYMEFNLSPIDDDDVKKALVRAWIAITWRNTPLVAAHFDRDKFEKRLHDLIEDRNEIFSRFKTGEQNSKLFNWAQATYEWAINNVI